LQQLETLSPLANQPSQASVEIGGSPRRDRWRVILGAGTAVIAGLATLAKTQPASADCQGSPCCSLYSCTVCDYQVSRDRFQCPSGYWRAVWSCNEPGTGKLVWCGECAGVLNDCYSCPCACSIWFYN
jgi:hypothetical protein